MGDEGDESSIPLQQRKNDTGADNHARTCRAARKIWVLYEVIAESMWRAMGWVCDDRLNAVTKWWQSTQASGMKEDPCNHTRWKHKWWWHNRGCVWNKRATDWVGEEDWMSKRKILSARRQVKIRYIRT